MTDGEEPKMRTEPTAYEPTEIDAVELLAEIERHLAAVETFRAEGCEPAWADDEALTGSWRLEWPLAGRARDDSGLFSVETAA
jgi:hypothetical protein